MGRHLAVDEELRGFAWMMAKLEWRNAHGRPMSFELAWAIVEHVEAAAMRKTLDHRFAMGVRAAVTAVCQCLPRA